MISGLLCVSAVFGGAEPITVEAEEVVEAGNAADIVDTVSGNELGNPGAEPSGEQADGQVEEIVMADDTVSGNEAIPRELTENSVRDADASGIGWELDADGTLTISSDEGMKDWKDNGWSLHKEKVKTVTIMDGVTGIVKRAFLECTNLLSVDMPDSVTEIGWSAFESCSSLKTVIVPDGVKRMEIFIFKKCENLVSVTLPESLEFMSNTFEECSQLREIVIPPNVDFIAANTFKDCIQLEKVIMCSENKVTLAEGSAFNGCKFFADNAKGIIVPPGTEEKYIEAYRASTSNTASMYADYIRAHSHSWETGWASNPFHHWHECTSECTTRNIADKDGYAIHTEDAGTITKQPTQTETGIKSYRCSVCGYEMRTETIPAVGTAEGNGSGDKNDNGESGETPKNESTGSTGSENDITVNKVEDITENDVAVNYDGTGSDIGNAKTQPVKDREPKTGDSAQTELYATLAMVMGLTYLLLYFTDRRHGMTEETKKELVSKLIGWARQGGYCRRLAAIAAIFILLTYYHGIGKKIALEWKEVYGE